MIDFCCVVESPAWIGDVGIKIVVESFSNELADVEINVWPRVLGQCPPTSVTPTPIAGYVATIPAYSILTIDGAREEITLYNKTGRITTEGLSAVTPDGSDFLLWPTVGGACRAACVCVDYTDPDTSADGATVEVYSIVRET